jgi:uncharacterized protein (UPF0335 family)
MKKQSATPVVEVRYSVDFVRRVGKLEEQQGTINEERKALVTELASHYGVALIREAKDGGVNFTKPQKDEASRFDVSVATIQEIDEVRQGINKVLGAHGWRDYLRALYPKNAKEASAPKDEPESVKVLKAAKADHEHIAKQCRAEVKALSEQIKTATGEDKLRLMEEQSAVRLDAARADMLAKQCANDIKAIAEDNAGADAYGALVEALKKLGDRYKAHKDAEVKELAQQVLALL